MQIPHLNGSRLLAKVLITIQVYIAAGNRDVCLHNLFKKREVVLLFLLSLWDGSKLSQNDGFNYVESEYVSRTIYGLTTAPYSH